jgi:hypothetical protein
VRGVSSFVDSELVAGADISLTLSLSLKGEGRAKYLGEKFNSFLKLIINSN